ncbi:hypothetical protein [Siphonobacter aquaeclarae]|jgi:hypothetical protein|uniref:Uncharacterized protein n=1 Tax=Siphonobacter aquaeclarae TaxID=563176 RepID=A0A1G9NJ96_9BACT|nr:hypothetical protein [Siphonobacter aquaeclarae]MBO9636629.1 hypothetical protein [Siphonobacter aquaeclarae]SDL86656.1 hypothetical protein SAMN04488090_2036 [Siphonobacter aquaeclarae]
MTASLYTILLVGSVALVSLSLIIICLVFYLHRQMTRPGGSGFTTIFYARRTYGQ